MKVDLEHLALYEMFATVDDVFSEEGAFDAKDIYKSLGRIYREWKKCRQALDQSFEPRRYKQGPDEMNPTQWRPPAKGSILTSSTDQPSTSEKSGGQTRMPGSNLRSASARHALCVRNASRGR